jgi:hypothetical protein
MPALRLNALKFLILEHDAIRRFRLAASCFGEFAMDQSDGLAALA